MHVSKITVSRTIQLRQYEPFTVTAEVTLEQGETTDDALMRGMEIIDHAIGNRRDPLIPRPQRKAADDEDIPF